MKCIRSGFFIVFASLFLLSGCGGEVKRQHVALSPVNAFQVEDIIREEKNYAVNKIHNVYVGEAIIRKKVFLDKIQSELIGRPMMDIALRSGQLVIDLLSSKEYPVTSRVSLAGRPHNVLEVLQQIEGTIFGIMVDQDGQVLPQVLNGDVLMKRHFAVMPLTGQVQIEHKKTLMSSQMMDNFEIVFGGINDNQMSFTYREFTAEDIAKTAFFQQLTYPVKSKVIRFKTHKIKVHDVTSESITYEVLEE